MGCIVSPPGRLDFALELVKLGKLVQLEPEEFPQTGGEDGQQVAGSMLIQQVHEVVKGGRQLLFDGRMNRPFLELIHQIGHDISGCSAVAQPLPVYHRG